MIPLTVRDQAFVNSWPLFFEWFQVPHQWAFYVLQYPRAYQQVCITIIYHYHYISIYRSIDIIQIYYKYIGDYWKLSALIGCRLGYYEHSTIVKKIW